MKTIKLKNPALLTVLIMSVLFIPTLVYGQSVSNDLGTAPKSDQMPTEKGVIISTREVRLKSDVDPKVFENWINEYWNQEWRNLIPGFQSYVVKNHSEKDPNLYAYFLIFNSKRLKNPNYSDSKNNIAWYRELIYYEPTKHLYDELFEYIEIDPFFTNIAWFEIK